MAGLLAALVGHLVALQFSFGLVVSRTLFWTDLALLAALAAQAGLPAVPIAQAGDEARSALPSRRRRRRRRRPAPRTGEPGPVALLESAGEDRPARALILGLILGVLLADFLLAQIELLNPALLGLVGLTWVLGGVLTLTGAGDGLKLDRSGLSWPVLSVGWGLLVPLLLVLARLGRGFYPPVFYLLFLVWLGLTLAGLALALSGPGPRRLLLWRSGRWPWYLGLALITGLAIFLANVNLILADINFKMAQILRDSGRWDLSIAFHQRALNLAPAHDDYYFSLAQIYLSRTKAAADAEGRRAALEEALQAIRRATELAPRDATHFWNLGRLYRLSTEQTADLAGQRARLEQALDTLSIRQSSWSPTGPTCTRSKRRSIWPWESSRKR